MKTSYIIALAVFFVVIVLLVVFRNQITAAVTPPSKPSGNTNPSAGTDTHPVTINYDKLLKKGVTGPEVKFLQQWLGITVDGIFGSQTEAALFAKTGANETTLYMYQQFFAGTSQTPPPTNANNQDVINWSDSNGDGSFVDTIGGYLFNWLS